MVVYWLLLATVLFLAFVSAGKKHSAKSSVGLMPVALGATVFLAIVAVACHTLKTNAGSSVGMAAVEGETVVIAHLRAGRKKKAGCLLSRGIFAYSNASANRNGPQRDPYSSNIGDVGGDPELV